MLKTGGVKMFTFGSFANPVKGWHIQISKYPHVSTGSCDFPFLHLLRDGTKRFSCQGKGAD